MLDADKGPHTLHLFIVSPKNVACKYLRIPKKWASSQRESGELSVHGE